MTSESFRVFADFATSEGSASDRCTRGRFWQTSMSRWVIEFSRINSHFSGTMSRSHRKRNISHPAVPTHFFFCIYLRQRVVSSLDGVTDAVILSSYCSYANEINEQLTGAMNCMIWLNPEHAHFNYVTRQIRVAVNKYLYT